MARVLLVDDDPDQLEIRKLLLEQAGHDVRAALGAPDAENACRTFTPQLAVMDLRIPHSGDGLRLIRSLRAAVAGIHIIVLSGWPADLSDTPEASLVKLVLSKPVRTRQLVEAIARLAP